MNIWCIIAYSTAYVYGILCIANYGNRKPSNNCFTELKVTCFPSLSRIRIRSISSSGSGSTYSLFKKSSFLRLCLYESQILRQFTCCTVYNDVSVPILIPKFPSCSSFFLVNLFLSFFPKYPAESIVTVFFSAFFKSYLLIIIYCYPVCRQNQTDNKGIFIEIVNITF